MLFSRSRASANLRKLFADQFEPDGDHFLYRRNSRDAPVRVTGAEREAFIADFNRAWRRMMVGLMAALMVVAAGFVAFDLETHRDPPEPALTIAIVALILVMLVFHRRAWNAPARALERRPERGRERSRGEMRRLMMERMTWRTLAGMTLVLPVAALQWQDAAAEGSAMRYFWLAFFVAMAAMLPVLAWRKWRLGRSDGGPGPR
jgi:hypothetical protein